MPDLITMSTLCVIIEKLECVALDSELMFKQTDHLKYILSNAENILFHAVGNLRNLPHFQHSYMKSPPCAPLLCPLPFLVPRPSLPPPHSLPLLPQKYTNTDMKLMDGFGQLSTFRYEQ